MPGKKNSSSSAIKLPSASDPEWRLYYSEHNEKLKAEHPKSTGLWRRKQIQGQWKKEHAPESEPVKVKETKQRKNKKEESSDE
ncbi:hypothetical protein JCM5353_003604 [Sporobolomyces roseus]